MGPVPPGALLMIGSLICVSPVQAASAITSDGTLGTTATQSANVVNINGGTRPGNGPNLFHSFGLFSVAAGDVANFSNTSGLPTSNILSRVTGGQASNILGTIRTTNFNGTNLFLLNPAGVIVGPGASLDISGSFHVSTADYLRFADGARFFANLNQPSVLTVAQPAAFGFLGPNAAPLSVQGSFLQVPVGRTLQVVGGNVTITGSTLFAPGGQVQIAGAGSAGEVTPVGAAASADLRLDGFSQLGDVTISQSILSTNGLVFTTNPAGSIVIRGGQIVVQSSDVFAIGNPGGVVRIGAERLDLSGTDVNTGTRGVANHSGTAVDVAVTGLATLRNGSEIASSSSGAGRAGGVRFRAGSVVLGDDDPATSPSSGIGFYGDIGSRAFAAGRGGDVEVTAADLTIKNGFFINTAALSTGNAGNVTLRADTLRILDGASISSNGFGLGRGGVVDIEAGEALISARNINSVPNCFCFTGVAAQAGFGSPGGAIRMKADVLRLLDGGKVSTTLFSIGPGANIDITVKQLIISGIVLQATTSPSDVHAGIDARVIGGFASGTGGNIRVIADSVDVADGGSISTSLFSGAPGTAGNIAIEAGRVDIRNRGGIFASSAFGSGNAGAITLTGDSLAITGVADAPDPSFADFTGLSTSTGPTGLRGGDIGLNVKHIDLRDKGSVLSVTLGPADAGNILIKAGTLVVRGGALIAASTEGTGDGGSIEVWADSVTVTGAGRFLGPANPGVSGIASQASTGGGDAGDIRITAGQLAVLDSGRVTTETFGPGAGGNIDVAAGSVVVSGVNPAFQAALNSVPGAGHSSGAAITANSSRFLLGDAATGGAGTVRIQAGEVLIASGGVISSTTDTQGPGGNIGIQAAKLQMTDGGAISATSASQSTEALAGNIDIVIGNTLRMVGSTITTDAQVADGGNISITTTGSLMHLTNSQITTSVQSGVGKGGNITIGSAIHPLDFVVLNNGGIHANAFGGPGGNINIFADVFLSSTPLATAVTASSALSTPGIIDIQSPITDVSGGVVQLPEEILQAATLLRASCAARLAGGKSSSLVLAGRGGLPPEPGGLLPSPLYLGADSAMSSGNRGLPGKDPTSSHSQFPLFGSGSERVQLGMGWNQFQLAKTVLGFGCSQ